jgi:exportin-T
MKVVMRNETFQNLFVALHTSDITFHSHREVLALYYETAVLYHPLLKERTELLQRVLESLTGQRGLQHEHPRVRSRCCYLLLRLVKSVGSSNASNSVLRPYVETVVSGIQGLLQNNSVQLRLDDTLNLFETIGLLLGRTAGLDAAEQERHLTQVMTPHVRSIEQILEQKQAVAQESEAYGEILSGSIAAIAFGRTRHWIAAPRTTVGIFVHH